jgi:hypothetical protein
MKIIRSVAAGAGALGLVAVVAAGAVWARGPAPAQTFVVHGNGYPEHNDVVAAGPIHGRGSETVSDEAHQGDPDGDSSFQQVSELALERGSVFVRVDGRQRLQLDERTCAGRIDGTVTWTLIPERGTGPYAGATGGGKGTLTDRFVVPRDENGCVHAPVGSNVFVAHLRGTAAVPTPAAA